MEVTRAYLYLYLQNTQCSVRDVLTEINAKCADCRKPGSKRTRQEMCAVC